MNIRRSARLAGWVLAANAVALAVTVLLGRGAAGGALHRLAALCRIG